MIKKVTAVLLVLLLAGSGLVWAVEGETTDPLSAGDPFYDSIISLLTAQFELSGEPVEQMLILNSLADQLVEAILAGADAVYLEELLAELENSEALIDQMLMLIAGLESGENDNPENSAADEEAENGAADAAGDLDQEDEALDEAIDAVMAGRETRGWRLREKVADESLPEHVRANAQRALDQMTRAMVWTQSGEEGPPPWAAAQVRERWEWSESGREGPPPWANRSTNHNGEIEDDNNENDDNGNENDDNGNEDDEDDGDDGRGPGRNGGKNSGNGKGNGGK
ncbi:MAG: hypothetical protein AB1767_02400 [Bacillota bacterium]